MSFWWDGCRRHVPAISEPFANQLFWVVIRQGGSLGVMDEVKISGTGDVTITLDRPRAINSLSGEMLAAIGKAVEDSPRSIDLSGAGERGYCSGADIRELRSLALEDPEAAGDWLDFEYDVDAAIAAVHSGTAHLHGISMGGGLGDAGDGYWAVARRRCVFRAVPRPAACRAPPGHDGSLH